MTYPLGRLVEHDPRSRSFAHPETAEKPRSILWHRYSDILDQGQLGSCTGNAMAGWLGCAPHCGSRFEAVDFGEDLAVSLYSDATRLDPFPGRYPPDDTGSSGLAVAKAARRRGLIGSYGWCFTTAALLAALQHQPVIVGVPWFDDMFNPDSDGQVHIGGGIAGGHEFLIRGYDADAGVLLADNSWGTGWGRDGSFRISMDTWTRLRKEQADVTVPHL